MWHFMCNFDVQLSVCLVLFVGHLVWSSSSPPQTDPRKVWLCGSSLGHLSLKVGAVLCVFELLQIVKMFLFNDALHVIVQVHSINARECCSLQGERS